MEQSHQFLYHQYYSIQKNIEIQKLRIQEFSLEDQLNWQGNSYLIRQFVRKNLEQARHIFTDTNYICLIMACIIIYKMIVLLISLIVSVFSRSEHQIPIVQLNSKNYYLSMRVGSTNSPRILFTFDFNSSESFIDGSVFSSLQANKNHSLMVFTPKGSNLGYMNFTVLPTNISWVQHKGVIGLGLNSSFILMLEQKLKKNISLRIQLVGRAMVIEKHPCRNPQTGPFKVSLTTWTNVNYLTPLSLNFKPSEDFLTLLNKSKPNFQMNTDDYHEKLIEVECEDQQRTIKLKRFINCLNIDSSDNYECSVNVSKTPDVGLAIFTFPVKICKDGVDVGVTIIPTQSYAKYFLIILAVNALFGLIFLNRKKIGGWFSSTPEHASEQ